MTTQLPPAGWYKDPTGKPGQMYWDGHNWHQYQPPTGPPAAPATPRQPAPSERVGERRLTTAERAQILTQELAFLTAPTGVRGHVTSGGHVSVYQTGPKIKNREQLSAVVWTGMDYAHPAYIVLHLLFSVMTCGLYLPFWWWGLRKKPKVYTVAVDEYGNIIHTQHEISTAQRIQRWVVLAVLLWWAYQAMVVINGLQGATQGGS